MPGLYRQRRPEKTPLYGLLRDHVDELRSAFSTHYAPAYGHWRPELDRACERYLKCGIPKYGVAKVKCTNPECGEFYYLPFSCKLRGICPSCLQKNMLETALWVVEHILEDVPHRHFVFTIPKPLRRQFFHHREAQNDLSRIAGECVKTFLTETLGTGMVAAVMGIESAGEYLGANPHIHAIVADGLFLADGTFKPMPKYDEGAHIYLLSLWKKAVAKFVLEHEFITPEMMSKILGWRNTGFSIFCDRWIDFKRSDEKSVQEMLHLARYIAKPPFALENLVYKEGADTVILKGERITKWRKRNFETFDVLDFLAALMAHIPNFRQRTINYYGWYSNKTRGHQKKQHGEIKVDSGAPRPTEDQAKFRKTWAMLIKLVYEVDPLECVKCHSPMKIVAIIEDARLVEATLRRHGLWQESAPWLPRPPPIELSPPPNPEREPWLDDPSPED